MHCLGWCHINPKLPYTEAEGEIDLDPKNLQKKKAKSQQVMKEDDYWDVHVSC